MSTGREKRRANVAAAKERRQKIFAFGGLGVLAILLVIQGPKMLDALRRVRAPRRPLRRRDARCATPRRSEPAPARAALQGHRQRSRSPTRSLANNDPAAGDVAAPRRHARPLCQREAASRRLVSRRRRPPEPAARRCPKQIVIGTPDAGAVAKRGWIVVLASIQTRVGRALCRDASRRACGATALAPSRCSTPRRVSRFASGYFVVYTGPFATLARGSAFRSPCARVRVQDRVHPRDPSVLGCSHGFSPPRRRGDRARRAADRDGRDEHRHLRPRRGVQLRHRVESGARARHRRPEPSPTSRWRHSGAAPMWHRASTDSIARPATTTGPDGRTVLGRLRTSQLTCIFGDGFLIASRPMRRANGGTPPACQDRAPSPSATARRLGSGC